MWASLMKYINGGILPKLESYHMDYKERFEYFVEDRKAYVTPTEYDEIKKAVLEVKLDLMGIWNKVEDMQKEFAALKSDKDYETMLLNYHRWYALCWDFKNKYLDRDFVMTELSNKTEKVMKAATMNSEYCSMCMNKRDNMKCNNL